MTAAALDHRDRNSGDENGVEPPDEIEKLKVRKKSTRFGYLVRVCQRYFVGERIKGSHHMFKTPRSGDPRINLQEVRGNASHTRSSK